MASISPTHSNALSQLRDLLLLVPPPFIYITDPTNPRLLSTSLSHLLSSLAEEDENLRWVQTSGVACLNQRIFYDTVLNGLAKWKPRWDRDGGRNWTGSSRDDDEDEQGTGMRWNEDLSSFLHGVKALERDITARRKPVKGKGKQRADTDVDDEMIKLIIVVDNVERLDTELLVPLSRLDELSQTNTTVIFTSTAGWHDIRTDYGDAKDPYYIDIEPPNRTSAIAHLASAYTRLLQQSTSTHPPSLATFYAHFSTMLVDICFQSTKDVQQLEYISAAIWPQLVADLRADQQSEYDDADIAEEEEELQPPDEHARMILIKKYSPKIKLAMEDLIPRHLTAGAWLAANSGAKNDNDIAGQGRIPNLPLISKFILIAGFLASTNPTKSDFKMFGRTRDGLIGGGKKRKGGGTRKTANRTKEGAKIPIAQRLLGPSTFSLDRLMAILGGLMYEYWPEEEDLEEEDEDDVLQDGGRSTRDGEQRRACVYQAISSLASSQLLTRISAADKLDDPAVTFNLGKGVGYEMILELARDKRLGDFRLSEFMWENWG